MTTSVTSSTGVTVTQAQAQAFQKQHGNEATYKLAKESGFTNAQIAQALGVKKSDVDAYAASRAGGGDKQTGPKKSDKKVNNNTTSSHQGAQATQESKSQRRSDAVTVTGSTGAVVSRAQAQEFHKANGNQATFEKGKALGLSNAQMALLLEVDKSDVDMFEAQQTAPAGVGHPMAPSSTGASADDFSVTGASGQVVTRSEATEYAKTHTPEETYVAGRTRALTNAQMAELYDIEVADVDAVQRAVETKETLEDRLGVRSGGAVQETTPTGMVVTDRVAQAYLEENGAVLTYFRGKTIGLDDAQIATLLHLEASQVKGFVATLNAQGIGPDSPVSMPDSMTFPLPRNEDELLNQEAAARLWFMEWNPAVSPEGIQDWLQRRVHATVEAKQLYPGYDAFFDEQLRVEVARGLFRHDVPVSQFVDAVKDYPGLSEAEVHATLAAMGFPSPEIGQANASNGLVPHIRGVLAQVGLTGHGVNVRVLESFDSVHGDMVASIINDPNYGLAPGAHVDKYFLGQRPFAGETDGPTVGDLLPAVINQALGQMIDDMEGMVGPVPPIEILMREATQRAIADFTFGVFDDVTEQVLDFAASDD